MASPLVHQHGSTGMDCISLIDRRGCDLVWQDKIRVPAKAPSVLFNCCDALILIDNNGFRNKLLDQQVLKNLQLEVSDFFKDPCLQISLHRMTFDLTSLLREC